MGYGINVHCESTQSLCNFYLIDFETANHLFKSDSIEKPLQVNQGVWVAVGKSHHITLIWRTVFEVQAVIVQLVIILSTD
jgi:hypothetical protein